MSGSTLDICGTAYLCYVDGCDEFMGTLLTNNALQYRLHGNSPSCVHDDLVQTDEDHHTCCFDDTWKEIDLKVSHVNVPEPEFVIHQVMKSGEDNFSLTSKHVHFSTDDLLVDKEAGEFIEKYISKELADKDTLVCIGHMKIRYPDSFDKKTVSYLWV